MPPCSAFLSTRTVRVHPADVSRVREAARGLGLETHVVNARTERDLDAAFASLLRQHADALLIGGDALFSRASTTIATLATRHAIPAICGTREIAEAGVLMAYTANLPDAYRQNGIYVGRILKGAKPAHLPVMQPTKFEFVINLKTAKALGLPVPPDAAMETIGLSSAASRHRGCSR